MEHLQSTVHYDSRKLLLYEWCNRAGHAKKVLEKRQVAEMVAANSLRNGSALRSLDIGSATGRYPLWFSERGFRAVGYDVSEDAVEMARNTARGRANVEFYVKNVLDSEPETNSFSVITCMMGTLNHLPPWQHAKLFSWVRESLKPGGLFVVSSWNARCPYTSFLHFYTREETELIERNSVTPAAVKELARAASLEVERVAPVCFLPDECYNAWMGELDDSALFELEDHLASKLNSSDAQMFVVAMRKNVA